MIDVTDCPYPAGTKEHHAWIVEVYIPSLDDDRREQDRLRAGAEAIGGRLIDGQLWRHPIVRLLPPGVDFTLDNLAPELRAEPINVSLGPFTNPRENAR